MAIKTSKPFRNVGVGAQYLSFWTEPAEDGTPAFETDVNKLKTVKSIETNEERNSEAIFGSNEVYETDVSSEPPTLNVANLAFDKKLLVRMRGNKITGGFVEYSTYDEGEYFAYGVTYPKKGGKAIYTWYPKCKMVSMSDSAQTKDNSGPQSQDKTCVIQTYAFNDAGKYKVEYDLELLEENATPMTEDEFYAVPLLKPVTT